MNKTYLCIYLAFLCHKTTLLSSSELGMMSTVFIWVKLSCWTLDIQVNSRTDEEQDCIESG